MVDFSKQLTATEFLQLPTTNLPTELIQGEVIMAPAPTVDHQRLTRNLFKLIDRLIPDGEVLFAPTDVCLSEQDVVQPDVFWVSQANTNCTLSAKTK